MRWWVPVGTIGLVLFSLGGTGYAAETPANVTAALHAAYPGVMLYEEGPLVTRVFGVPFGYGASPEASAAEFVQRFSGVFGVPAQDLQPGSYLNGALTQPVMYENGEFRFTLVYYTQVRDELPVFRGELKVLTLNQPGAPVVWAGSTLMPLDGFRVPAGALDNVNVSAAQAAAALAVPGVIAFSDHYPVIYAGQNHQPAAPHVAIVFHGSDGLEGSPEPVQYLFVADAATGEILYKENEILDVDVTGTVHAIATPTPPELPKAAECLTSSEMALPYLRVGIGTNYVYADPNGNFTIPNSGSNPVTVSASLQYGRWFKVTNGASLSQSNVTPPGPVHFLFDPNDTELTRAEVNGYIQANKTRDFVLVQNPLYPGIYSYTTPFTINVNITSTCNAYYNGSSINFYRAGGGCYNTAYSGVVSHEYGHHVVQMAGSGQGAYGEGMADCVALLMADDPILGYGFRTNCAQGIRNAANTMQYPCSGEIHYCGQLLSGCVWSTRNELRNAYPNEYLSIISRLTINSVLLHSGTSITPQITIDFLTVDDDDGNIYNGTPHLNQICAGFGAHNMTCPPIGMEVTPQTGYEASGNLGGPFGPPGAYTLRNRGTSAFNYQVTGSQPWLTIEPASGSLAGGASTNVTVSINSAANSLPGGVHTGTLNFTNTTNGQGNTSREAKLYVGITPQYTWDLNANPGWSIQGQWAWGQPLGQAGDPNAGHTGGNVYGYNLAGAYPNNMPEYHLTTTPIDCSNLTSTRLRFWRWLGVEEGRYDHAYVRISTNGTNWTNLWENPYSGHVVDTSWVRQDFDISAIADRQPTVYVRWTMGTSDQGLTFCGWNIDDIEIWGATPVRRGDANCDGAVNFGDINPFVLALTDPNGYQAQYPNCPLANSDCNGDGRVDFGDINPFVALLAGQ
ncbi:MAG: hypothetical protein AB1716_14515 [Planctomycetota bacterium]